MRYGGFIQMPEVVQLMAVDLLEFPALLAGPWMRMLGIDRARGVQIAVGFLRGGDLRDQIVDVRLQLRIRQDAQSVRRTFDDLVQIGVVEWIPRRFLVRKR